MDELMELDEDDISKLTDEEFKDILINVNAIQQNKLGTMSVNYSVLGFIDIMHDIYNNNIFDKIKSEEERQLLEVYYKNIYKLIENIDERIENNENELAELIDLRHELDTLVTEIEPYIIEASYLVEKFDYYLTIKLAREKHGKLNIDQNEIDNLIYGIMSYLMEISREYKVFVEKTSVIIGYLPFRMTKEKFFEIVESALKRNLSNYTNFFVEHEIKNYKKIFDGSMEPSFGTKYDYYFRRVQELKKHKDLKNLTVEELVLYSKNSKTLIRELEDVSCFIRNMGIVVNKLISLFMISSSNNSFSIDRDTAKMWKDYFKNPKKESEKLEIALSKKITQLENEMMETNIYLEKLIMDSVNRKDLIEESFKEKFLFTNKALTYYNDISFMSEEILLNYEEDSSIVDEDYLDEVLNNYIQFLDRSIRLMSNDERKQRMRRLLSSLEFPFKNPEALIGYLESSLDLRITSNEEIVIAMESIDYIMHMENSDS